MWIVLLPGGTGDSYPRILFCLGSDHTFQFFLNLKIKLSLFLQTLDHSYYSNQAAVGTLLKRIGSASRPEYLYTVSSRISPPAGEFVLLEVEGQPSVLCRETCCLQGKVTLQVRGTNAVHTVQRDCVRDASAEANVSALNTFIEQELRRICAKLPEPYNNPATFPVLAAVCFALEEEVPPAVFSNVVRDFSRPYTDTTPQRFFESFGGSAGLIQGKGEGGGGGDGGTKNVRPLARSQTMTSNNRKLLTVNARDANASCYVLYNQNAYVQKMRGLCVRFPPPEYNRKYSQSESD